MQAAATHQPRPEESEIQRKILWDGAVLPATTALDTRIAALLKAWGLKSTLALLEDRPGLMEEAGTGTVLKTALRVLARLYTGEHEGTVMPARVSEIINWVFAPALAQRSTQWFEAAVSGLCVPGTCWPEQLAAAAAQRGADMPLHHLDQLLAMRCVPHDVPAFFAANTHRLKPSKFGLLVHAWFTRIRLQSSLDGKSTRANEALARKSAEELYRAAFQSILDSETPAPSSKTRRWARSLMTTKHPELIRKQPDCSLDMRVKLLSLVASVQGRDLPQQLLHWQRDELMDELSAAATQGLTIDRLRALREGFAQRLGDSYVRHAVRCLEQLQPDDAAARARHEKFIKDELESLQSILDATGNLRELKMAIQRNLLHFREALRAQAEPARSSPVARRTTAGAAPALSDIPIPGTLEENVNEPGSQDQAPLE